MKIEAPKNQIASAYPTYNPQHDQTFQFKGYAITGGLTKRELVAAMALQGILANPRPGMASAHAAPGSVVTSKSAALVAMEYADALLKALESESA